MAKLFSIKEEFSDRIFSKEKLVEFRRQNVNINNGERCLVYTSHPVKKITGYFVVKEKIRLPILKLWYKTREFAGISRKEFMNYFVGCQMGTAIIFKKVGKFVQGVNLIDIKKRNRNFRPPQSYYNIDKNFINILHKIDPNLRVSI